MGNFIGQEKLFKTFKGYFENPKNMPHTFIFLGEPGCGRHSMAKYLAGLLKFKFVDVAKVVEAKIKENPIASKPDVIEELLLDYSRTVLKTIYLIDLSVFDHINRQSQLLKFAEEPNNNNYIILMNSSKTDISTAIMNRSIKLRFEPYTVEQLEQIKYFENKLIYKICKTPGQLANIDANRFNNLQALCDKLITILPQSEYANIISIATKVNYKEDYNKFDFDTFFNMLSYVAFDKYLNTNSDTAYKVYLYVNKSLEALASNTKIQKEPFMINFLDGLWKEVKQ